MNESIYTIPINVVFEPKDGCPFCQLRDLLEKRSVEYILGSAMMEPDIRVQTNKLGFCGRHFSMMLQGKSRLGLGLLLESHLQELQGRIFKSGILAPSATKKAKKCGQVEESCYICEKIDNAFYKMVDNIIDLFDTSLDFKKLYGEQPFICLPHFHMVSERAEQKLGKKGELFIKTSAQLCEDYLNTLQKDVSHFCKMFDYRNTGTDWGNSRDALQRAIGFLTGEKVEK